MTLKIKTAYLFNNSLQTILHHGKIRALHELKQKKKPHTHTDTQIQTHTHTHAHAMYMYMQQRSEDSALIHLILLLGSKHYFFGPNKLNMKLFSYHRPTVAGSVDMQQTGCNDHGQGEAPLMGLHQQERNYPISKFTRHCNSVSTVSVFPSG